MTYQTPEGWTMRLTDLRPHLEGTERSGFLWFDCPYPGHTHKVGVRISDQPPHEDASGKPVWQAEGRFPDTLTLTPSINVCRPNVECWHGFIRMGVIQ